MASSLDDSINSLYAAFAGKPKPLSIDACDCCIAPEAREELVRTNLRELTKAQLGGYAADVFLPAGSREDFRYFIPRILDLSLHGALIWPDLHLICAKLAHAEWLIWREPLQAAIMKAFFAACETALTDGDVWGLERLLGDLRDGGVVVMPFVKRLEAMDEEGFLIDLQLSPHSP